MDNNGYAKQNNSRKGLSAAEFQQDLYNWFENRGFLDDLRTQLRHQMVTALRETRLGESSSKHSNIPLSPKIQATNLLIAEFLLHHDHHFTLSVFTSEVPFLRNMPKFTLSGTQITGCSFSNDIVPRFQENDVKDILECFGLPVESEIGSRIFNHYRQNVENTTLLTSILHNIPERRSSRSRTNVVWSASDLPVRDSQSNTSIKDGASSVKEGRTIKKIKELYKAEIQEIMYQSQMKSQHIKQLQEEIRRFQDTEVEKIRKEEEAKFHKQLVERESRIQADLTHREQEISKTLQAAENKISRQRQVLENDIKTKRQQLSELAGHLQEERIELGRKLLDVEEREKQMKSEEKRIEEMKQKDSLELAERTSVLDVRQQQLQQEFERLNAERESMTYIQLELEDSRRQLMEARQSLAHSQSELSFLRNIQQQCSHLRYELDATRLKLDNLAEREIKKSSDVQSNVSVLQPRIETVDRGLQTVSPQPAEPEGATALPTTTVAPLAQFQQHQTLEPDPENIPEEENVTELALLESQQQLQQQQQKEQYQYLTDMLRQLQQENEELRGYTQQQRLRIDELTTHATDLANQLEDAHTAITLISNRPPHEPGPSESRLLQPIYLSPGAGTITVPPLIAPPPPPPPPPPLPPQSPRHAAQSRQLGAGEELNYVTPPPPSQAPPLSFGSSSSISNTSHRREWRKKPPRRLMVHSNSNSSDESSPTEEILQEARRRLRKLEEESEAVDRSYQNFRRRHESLGTTASLLFHPVLTSSHLPYPGSSLGFGCFTSSRPLYSSATGGSHTPIIFSNFNYDNSPSSSQHNAPLFNPLLSTESRLFPPLYYSDRLPSASQFSAAGASHYAFPSRTQVPGGIGNLTSTLAGRIAPQPRFQGMSSGILPQSRFTMDPLDSRFSLPQQPSTIMEQPSSRGKQVKDKTDSPVSLPERRNSSSRINIPEPYNLASAEAYTHQHQTKTVTFSSHLKTTMVYTSPQVSSSVASPAKQADNNETMKTVESYTFRRPITTTIQSSPRFSNQNEISNRWVSSSFQENDPSTSSSNLENLYRLEYNQDHEVPRTLSTDNIWQIRNKLSSYFIPETPIKGSKDLVTPFNESGSLENSSVQKLFLSSDMSKSHTTISDEPQPSVSFAISETTESSNDFGVHFNIPQCTMSSEVRDTSTNREPMLQHDVGNYKHFKSHKDLIPTHEEMSEKSGSATHTQTTIVTRHEEAEKSTMIPLKRQDEHAAISSNQDIKQTMTEDVNSKTEEDRHSSEHTLKDVENSERLSLPSLQNNIGKHFEGPSTVSDAPELLQEIQTDVEGKNKSESSHSLVGIKGVSDTSIPSVYHGLTTEKDKSDVSVGEESDAIISIGEHSKEDESSKDDFW